MKTNKFLTLLITMVTFFAIVSCVQDDDYTVPTSIGDEENKGLEQILIDIDNGTLHLISIEDLKNIYDNYLDGIPNGVFDYDRFYQITSSLVVKGYVSSSDKTGNFYKEFYIQDAPENSTQALGVLLNQVDSYNQFNIGREVYIKLEGMYVGETSSEVIAVGGQPDDTEVGQFTANQIGNQIFRSSVTESITPLELTISQINESHIGKLITINDAQFPESLEGETYFDPSEDFDTSRNIEICDGFGYTNFVLETSSFSNFTDLVLPTGNGSITGILTNTYGGDNLVLVLNSVNDVQFNNARCTPLNIDDFSVIFEEDFDSGVDNTNLDILDWTNFAEEGGELWTEQVFSSNGYAEFSGYFTGDAVNIGWLISPGINMDSQENEFLNFKTAQHHLDSEDNTLEVFVSTDFTGDVLSASWTPIDVNLASMSNSWYNFIDSGLIDISSYSGTLYVGFKVVGSGTDTQLDGAYHVEDFTILATN